MDCEELKKLKNPRSLARSKGYATYIPTEKCTKCGNKSPRKVTNNVCTTCLVKKPVRMNNNTTKFMEDNPDMIIDKQTASVLNLIVYRTGLPCRRGHKFWRYVDGGACIACMRPNTYKPEIKLIEQPPYVVKLNEQPSLFVGYAYDKKRIIGPDGRKLNELQFNSLFEETAFELKDGKVVHSAFKAFVHNFTK